MVAIWCIGNLIYDLFNTPAYLFSVKQSLLEGALLGAATGFIMIMVSGGQSGSDHPMSKRGRMEDTDDSIKFMLWLVSLFYR